MISFPDLQVPPLDEHQRRAHKRRNLVHSWAILAAAVGLLALMAWSLAGPQGIFWAVVAGGVTLWSVARMTPELILKLYRAKPLPPQVFKRGNDIVAELARRAGLATAPTLYYVPSKMMNAFAVGRPDKSAIAVTDGLIRGLTLRQFAGVMAHEMSHIRNGDVRVMALADMVARLTGTMSTVGILMLVFFAPSILDGNGVPWLAIALLILAPYITNLLQLGLSRTREYDADLDAVGLTGDPEGLASALQTLERKQGGMWERLMLPGGGRIPDPSLLRTHPKTEDRVARLMSLRQPARPPDLGPHATSVPGVSAAFAAAASANPRLHRTGVWY